MRPSSPLISVLVTVLVTVLIAVLATGCDAASSSSRSSIASPSPSPSPSPSAGAASDMCPEHGVLEVLCTRHHPSLIAVFQAKGDWCAEHDFPESICPLCHPERGGRPAPDINVDDDGAPADGTRVTLKSPGLAAQVGIATVVAVERPGGAVVSAVAQIVYDASRVAQVNARAPGVVRALKVDVGSTVQRGQTLALLDSAAVGADRGNLLAAQARLQVAEAAVARERALLTKGISAHKDVEAAIREAAAAAADVAAAAAALSVVGVGVAGGYAVTAPLGGTVVERHVAVGQTVGVEAPLFQIVDASAMWAEVDVAERDLATVTEGQAVELDIDALPGRHFKGTIQYLAPSLDPHTRTARARVALKNDDRALRGRMYGTARIAVAGTRTSVWVPRTAVQHAKGVLLVFVTTGEGLYQAHRVVVGATDGDLVEVVSGIAVGADVVTTGSFLLKTETLPDAIGAGCCD